MPFMKIQWVKKRVAKKPVTQPSPPYMIEPPASMTGLPAFMANRRLAQLFTPEGRTSFVTNHLRLDPQTAAIYEQAMRDGTHMIGMRGYGVLWKERKGAVDYFVAIERGGNRYLTWFTWFIEKDDTLIMVP
jgi:hypothetical protein